MAKSGKPNRSPVLEWVSAAIGLAFTLGLVAVLAVAAFGAREGVPPIIEAAPVSITPAGDGYFVELEVRNRSHTTGAGVQVEGTLTQGGSNLETSSTTVSFVPGHSTRRAGLVFRNDPREHELDLRVTGYEQP